jgi:hypothetical protein
MSTETDSNWSTTDASVAADAPYTGIIIYTTLDGSGFQAWANSTVYAANAVVSDGGRWYITALGGTSSGTGVGDDTGVTDWAAYSGERQIDGIYYAFNIIIDGNSATKQQVWEKHQYNLRQTSDIDQHVSISQRGDTATDKLSWEGSTLVTDQGVYVDNFQISEQSEYIFTDVNGGRRSIALVSTISVLGLPTAGGSIRLQVYNDTAKTASAWAANTSYSLGDKVLRSTGVGTEQTAGLYMVCTTAGTSHATTEPTWNTSVGATTSDNTVVWTTYAILYHDADPATASYSDTYTDGEEFSSGDTYRIRFAELNGTTSFKTFETTGITSSTGFSVSATMTTDSVYGLNAIDGSSAAVTNKFSPDYSNNEIDLDTNSDFAVTEAFAYYCYELTTSNGMYTVWGAVTGIDTGNYRNNTSVFSIYFDETAGFVKQTDSARWFRDDDTRPARDPTTGGSGIEINWRNPVYAYDGGGGGYSSADRARDDAIKSKTDNLSFTVSGQVDSNVKYVHDIEVDGSGTSGDPWGPV